MQALLDSVRQAIADRNWYAALTLTLTLPDICGKVDTPELGSNKRYAAWFDNYVGPTYKTQFAHEPTPHIFLSGNDCYALRCSFLHEGTSDITAQRAREALEHFIFLAPKEVGSMHICQTGNKLILEVDKFCADILAGIQKWFNDILPDSQKQ